LGLAAQAFNGVMDANFRWHDGAYGAPKRTPVTDQAGIMSSGGHAPAFGGKDP